MSQTVCAPGRQEGFEGTIVALQDNTVLLGTDENIVVRIPLEKVAKANLVYRGLRQEGGYIPA